MLLMGLLIWKINLFCLSCLCVVRTAILCSKIVNFWLHIRNLLTTKKANIFSPFICKFNNFEYTWHCSIHACIRTLSGLYSLRNREEQFTSGLLFFLFRKLLMINVIFAFNVHIVVYLSVDDIAAILFIVLNQNYKGA